jgi:DNA-binding MarR family transcriptional regulator
MARTSRQAIKDSSKAEAPSAGIDSLAAFLSMPGYLIRRSKQTSTSMFMEACKDTGITPIQFAALSILRFRSGIDQTELGEIAGLDPSTVGDVIQRLQRRGLLRRDEHGLRRLCHLTAEGSAMLEQITPLVAQSQQRILAPLTARERVQFLRLMSKLNGVTNHYNTTLEDSRRRRRAAIRESLPIETPPPRQ